jgi:hypothetical protein
MYQANLDKFKHGKDTEEQPPPTPIKEVFSITKKSI